MNKEEINESEQTLTGQAFCRNRKSGAFRQAEDEAEGI